MVPNKPTIHFDHFVDDRFVETDGMFILII